MTRRQLLQSAAGFAAATVTAFPAKEFLKAGVQTSAWKIPNDDFPALLKVLQEASKFGFEGFETNFRSVQSVFGKQAKDAKAQIAATGLRFLGCHVTFSHYDAKTNVPAFDELEPIADGAAALGAERLILSGAPVADEGAALDPERLSWKSGAINRAGRYGYDLRLRVCYHNQAFEFSNGGAEINALMREADSDNVHFIIDAPDAMQEKADIAAFFTKYHKRIDGFHLRGFSELQYEPLAIAIKKLKWTGWLIADEKSDAAIPAARDKIRTLFGT